MSPASSVIEVHDLTVSYDKKPVLWNVDFDIPKGKLVGIIGPNGAGKSTFLKSVMDLLPLNSGYIKIMGESIDSVRDKVSYVPQTESVDWDFPASVLDVVLMGRYSRKNVFKRITKKDKEVALECIHKVGMQNFINRQISQLSGGQQQRVFIARSLAQNADLYLMDEPFAGVDAATESTIIDILEEMKQDGKTILVVHHDLQSAYEYFDWIVLLNTRLIAAGPKEEVFTSKNLQETYGGQLTILSKISSLIKEKNLPVRE